MITKHRLIFLAEMLGLSSLLMISSCRKEGSIGNAPSLPPLESFLINFNNFSNPDDTLALKLNSESFENLPAYNNWGKVHNIVKFWNEINNYPMTIITACYLQALKINPVYIGNNSFGWVSTFNYLDIGYSARIIAILLSSELFKVEMYIDRPGLSGFESFKWFEGTIRFDMTRIIWTLYERPENPVRLLRIESKKNPDNNNVDITYIYSKRDQIETGNSIQFKTNNEFYFDASYIVTTSGDKVLIEWSREDRNGHISEPFKFGNNGEWHCWTELLQDTDCQ